jgi:hypothetical protein
LQERSFSRRRASVKFREATSWQTARDFIENRDSRGDRTRGFQVRKAEG